MSFISIKNLVHKFYVKDDDGNIIEENDAINGVSLDVERGQFIAILGQNGSGKSTLARHLNNLLFPDEGSIWIDNVAVNESDDENVWMNRKKIGMVFQNPDNQIIGTTVEEDTAFGPENLGIQTKNIRRRVDESLQTVGMDNRKKSSPNHLSGGQKQRIAIAGILAMHPCCIVLDEASAMLDPDGRRELLNTIHRLNKDEEITIILITHFMEEAVDADKVFVMEKGKIKLHGTPQQVFGESQSIKSAGLELPEIMKLSLQLKDDGYDIPTGMFTINEFADEFEKAYRNRSDN
ncbi:MAG: energy-coupling factor transporter ATPase [Lachnospiraceae bacterium]|nr:energy-coupling factor transporter ATPase [Lachnospiraceae bacterium]